MCQDLKIPLLGKVPLDPLIGESGAHAACTAILALEVWFAGAGAGVRAGPAEEKQ